MTAGFILKRYWIEISAGRKLQNRENMFGGFISVTTARKA